MNTITLMIGSDKEALGKMQQGEFMDLTWMSDNMETVAHYFEGCVIEVDVELDTEMQTEYAACMEELPVPLSEYGWGCVETRCPEGAIWYSFSAKYLKEHLKGIREIFPDLSPWDDPDDVEFENLMRRAFIEKDITLEEAAKELDMTQERLIHVGKIMFPDLELNSGGPITAKE